MTTTLEESALIAVQGQTNVWKITLTDKATGTVQNLTGKTLTAKVKHDGVGSPLALTMGSGLAIVTPAAGLLSITLDAAAIAPMPLDSTAYVYLTIWNADDTQHAHGAFPMVISLG